MIAYIDDLNVIEKIRHCDGVAELTVNKPTVHAHAHQSEDYFAAVADRASSELNMRVNVAKTQVLCISASASSTVDSYINTPGTSITSRKTLQILGFWFGESGRQPPC